MISSSAFDLLLSILVFGICWGQLNASSQATLSHMVLMKQQNHLDSLVLLDLQVKKYGLV